MRVSSAKMFGCYYAERLSGALTPSPLAWCCLLRCFGSAALVTVDRFDRYSEVRISSPTSSVETCIATGRCARRRFRPEAK